MAATDLAIGWDVSALFKCHVQHLRLATAAAKGVCKFYWNSLLSVTHNSRNDKPMIAVIVAHNSRKGAMHPYVRASSTHWLNSLPDSTHNFYTKASMAVLESMRSKTSSEL